MSAKKPHADVTPSRTPSSAKKSHPEISPRPLIGIARRQMDWQETFIGKIFSNLVNFCRKRLAQNVETTLKCYFFVVFLCSLLSTFIELPRGDFYFLRRRNFLNDYFVKYSWGWTLVLLGNFIFWSSLIYTARTLKLMSRPIARILIATALWFCCVNSFVYIEKRNFLAGCSLGSYENEADCEKNNGKWRQFEISGHVFILTYIALITAEELSIFERWGHLGRLLRQLNLNASVDENDAYNVDRAALSKLSETERATVEFLYRRLSFLVGVFYILNVLFSVLWLAMITVTSLYYHQFEQKMVAFGVAFFCWYATYRFCYPRFYPGVPGFGRIRL